MERELTPKEIKIAREKFFVEGWNDPEKLDFLDEDKIDSYEKVFSFDVFPYVRKTFQYMKGCKMDMSFLKEQIWDVLPIEEKELDYFLANNWRFSVIIHTCQNSIKNYFEEKRAKIEKELQSIKDIKMEEINKNYLQLTSNIEILKKWNDPRANDFAKHTAKDIENYIDRIKTKNKGADPKKINRDSNIRTEYEVLLKKYHDNHKFVREELGKKYNLKPSTIKSIQYSFKDLLN